jgi:NAD(P)H-flavin reductase/ferredoxin
MTSNPVQLRTLDHQIVEFDCDEDEWVLDAAAEAGYTLPSLCGKGTCGGCFAHVADGDFQLGEHEDAALPRRRGEVVPGSVLLCRTRACGPLTVDLPYDRARIVDGALPERGAQVVSITKIAETTVRVELQLDPHPTVGAGLEFEPGQFLEVEIPGTDVRRAYSIANPPNWDGVAVLLIHLRPGGAFSTWLDGEAGPGSRLTVRGPQGAFGLRDNGIRPRWFVAGGMGLAPVLSMMRRMAEWADPQPVRLFLGVGTDADVPELPELAEAGAQLTDFKVTTSVWQPGPRWTGTVGTPVDALADALVDQSPKPDVYVCGPPAMVDAAAEVARDNGVTEQGIILERYLPTGV